VPIPKSLFVVELLPGVQGPVPGVWAYNEVV
jgi:hypothetical protein